jgi:hypothetical protein
LHRCLLCGLTFCLFPPMMFPSPFQLYPSPLLFPFSTNFSYHIIYGCKCNVNLLCIYACCSLLRYLNSFISSLAKFLAINLDCNCWLAPALRRCPRKARYERIQNRCILLWNYNEGTFDFSILG